MVNLYRMLKHHLEKLMLQSAYIENMSWNTIVEKYDRPHTLFYPDPPCWQTEGYGVEFRVDHYERMAELAADIKGSMVISINDHPDIKAVFKELFLRSCF